MKNVKRNCVLTRFMMLGIMTGASDRTSLQCAHSKVLMIVHTFVRLDKWVQLWSWQDQLSSLDQYMLTFNMRTDCICTGQSPRIGLE